MALRWIIGALWVAFIVLSLINVFVNAERSGSPHLGLNLAVGIVGFLAVLALILLGLGRSARKRNEALTEGSTTRVSWTTGLDHGLTTALSELKGSEVSGLPLMLSAVLDSDGLEIVSGDEARLRVHFRIPRSEFIEVRRARVKGTYTIQKGIEVCVRGGATGSVVVPLPIFGGGLGGMFPASESRVAKLVEDISRVLEQD
ncbi:hypothetical protein M2152_000619 [Microbacteriaceae bacterium SG_E_30_P1]|uniref:Uncharacterized protein n=1 Tax=Antiquaquibacter oligotrophicus TaxID=2880260 RepID=A0ABT6KMS8_9MICO|nr:hypothetical protein [Antiquaquibacter oligotrophicus]MDH6180437.1 hypothetical protein [Antiquaquibacter oligotrophicus]UDF13825.1 hypothetical protein LH407_02925 [Antiquaquibacter oligotrophicus]